MKIVNFKKFIRSIVLLLGVIFIFSLIISKSTFSHTEIKYRTMYIGEGDTLWNIAQNLQNGTYYNNKDIRYIIDDLIKINGLHSSYLYANQKIKIPTL